MTRVGAIPAELKAARDQAVVKGSSAAPSHIYITICECVSAWTHSTPDLISCHEGNRSSKQFPATFYGLIALSPLGFQLVFSERFPFQLIEMFWDEIVWRDAQHCEWTVSYTPLDFTLQSN